MGISIYMRIKDERDWVSAAIASVKDFADEIIVVDHGSTDGTYEILKDMEHTEGGLIKLWQKADLPLVDLSNFALQQTSFHWAFRLDGDMIAHTDGPYALSGLRRRLLALNPKRYYVIYLRHINLSGDLFHQDPEEMVHIEEYIHTFNAMARFIHPRRFEAIKFPLYYKPLFWYEPYVFHVNVKPARRMLLRYFWEDWMEDEKDPPAARLEDYVKMRIEKAFNTIFWEEAESRFLAQTLKHHIAFNQQTLGPYPALLKNFLLQSQ